MEKSELLDHVWNGAFVEEASVSKCIWEIRAALNDDSKDSEFIRTVPKRGYRFVAEVTVESDADATQTADEPAVPILSGSPAEDTAMELVTRPDAEAGDLAEVGDRASGLPAGKPWKRLSKVVLAVGVTAVAVALVFAYFFRSKPVAALPSNAVRLAVLPLRPVVAEGRDQALEFAIADSLIQKLSDTKGLDVKRLFAVRKYTDLEADPVVAGQELEVSYVLASTYQVSDGRIRVTGQLVNVATGICEQTFRTETDAGDIFAIQDIVATDFGNGVLVKFNISPGAEAAMRSTENAKAYRLYNEALYLVDKYTREDSMKAVELLDQAVALDPNYAAAWAIKAQAYCQFAHQGGGIPSEVFAKAEPNLEKALVIDNNNAVALTIRGMINRDYYWKFADAYRDLDRAIALDPKYILAHRILAGNYYHEGRFSEAVAEGQRTVDLNPAGLWDKLFLAEYQASAGSTNEAIAGLLHMTEIDPKFKPTYFFLWSTYLRIGDTEKAAEYFIKNKEIWGDDPKELDRFRKIYASSGWNGLLRAELELMISQDRPNQYSTRKLYIAELAAQLGEADVAFRYLEEAFKFRQLGFSYLRVNALLLPLHNDPRFEDLATRAKL
ncbi:MAG: transcriptional regulator domain-containing protein [Acidobacteria bacterium OLB17]|nr:MAG: transcriptional regulator domain-containing protein [Acidobacteria bacterium OLB17]